MKSRILAVSLLMLLLPVLFGNADTTSNQLAGVVYAGHVWGSGAYCTCGDANCIYDPGECGDHGRPAPKPTNSMPGTTDLSGIIAILLVVIALRYRLK